MLWILLSYFQYLFLRDSDKRTSPPAAPGGGGGGERTETDFLRHYSYVALNIGCHFTLCAVFNDQEYSDPSLG